MVIISKFSGISLTVLLLGVDAAKLIPFEAPKEDLIPNSYIVVMKDEVTKLDFNSHVAWATNLHHEILSKRGATSFAGMKFTYDVNGWLGYSGNFDEETLQEILDNPNVNYVEQDRIVRASVLPKTLNKREETVQRNAPAWGLGRISHKKGGSRDFVYDDTAGEGVTVYGVDSGIDVNHPDFGGRATWGHNAVDRQNNDGYGHGTHTAGTIASTTYGVAKKASVVAVKVLDANGHGSESGIIQGINWATQHAQQNGHTGKAVINLSLGAPNSNALNDVASRAVQAGIFVTVASGNDNRDASNYTPASARGVCTAAASSQGDTKASFSNFGPVIAVYAPGDQILSIEPNGRTGTRSGTSMASPHIAGVAAALIASENADIASLCSRIKQLAGEAIRNPGSRTTGKLLYNNSGK
ncbi:Secreted subtilisin-like serine protease sub11 [Myotisia sp. PD_48]|nr:Secreted subtilisin-like serine protease sub11 [Myotisia sp. PD_48]